MQNTWVKRKSLFKIFLIFLVTFFLILIALVVAATFLVKSSFAAPSSKAEEKIFVIKEGESLSSVGERLKTEGLIKDSRAFRLYARFSCEGVSLTNPLTLLKSYAQKDCLAANIQAGSFKLTTNLELPDLAKKLTHGRLDSWTKILEGWRNEEIAEQLAKNYPIKEEDFLKEAQIGYMYPDTYLFKVGSSASEIIQKLRATFDQKFTPDLQQKAQAQGLTLNEAITLASLIERETRNDGDERAVVAGILLKRLSEGWKLEVDATVQYALGYNKEEKTWWKKSLTEQDLAVNSPYNTRRFAGLPPGPICNPGLAALKAVAEPVASDYYFYLHDKDGKIRYGRTLQEHNDNKTRYLQ